VSLNALQGGIKILDQSHLAIYQMGSLLPNNSGKRVTITSIAGRPAPIDGPPGIFKGSEVKHRLPSHIKNGGLEEFHVTRLIAVWLAMSADAFEPGQAS
jgi:hypothetical protein